jgi:hypothetical protein
MKLLTGDWPCPTPAPKASVSSSPDHAEQSLPFHRAGVGQQPMTETEPAIGKQQFVLFVRIEFLEQPDQGMEQGAVPTLRQEEHACRTKVLGSQEPAPHI